MFLPHYNTKAITIAQIFDGRAKLELASPHLAREKSEEDEEDRREGQIQKVTSTVKKDDVFVALAGHPFALRTSKKDNLWMVAFLLSAENNQRNFLGGIYIYILATCRPYYTIMFIVKFALQIICYIEARFSTTSGPKYKT